jgi:prepilin-type N-terminal cleavage/methylation domain-containing protein
MYRNQKGFTLIEIIVVFLLMSIIAATVLGRSLGTSNLDLARQANKIRGQIIYAQSAAMKNNGVWGIECDGTNKRYWLFSGEGGSTEIVRFPGEANDFISLAEMNVTMNTFKLLFNKFGQPFKNDTSPANAITAAYNPLITISSGSLTPVDISIEPETGLLR